MNEAIARPAHAAEAASDRVAVGLELLPLLALLTPFAAIITIRWEELDVETMLLRASAVALASGLGWLKRGMPLQALAVLVVRAAALSLLVWWAYASVSAEVSVRQCDDVCSGTPPLIPSIVPVVLVAAVYVVSTCVSAWFVSRASRNAADASIALDHS